jgi:hypothetical protein
MLVTEYPIKALRALPVSLELRVDWTVAKLTEANCCTLGGSDTLGKRLVANKHSQRMLLCSHMDSAAHNSCN